MVLKGPYLSWSLCRIPKKVKGNGTGKGNTIPPQREPNQGCSEDRVERVERKDKGIPV